MGVSDVFLSSTTRVGVFSLARSLDPSHTYPRTIFYWSLILLAHLGILFVSSDGQKRLKCSRKHARHLFRWVAFRSLPSINSSLLSCWKAIMNMIVLSRSIFSLSFFRILGNEREREREREAKGKERSPVDNISSLMNLIDLVLQV